MERILDTATLAYLRDPGGPIEALARDDHSPEVRVA